MADNQASVQAEDQSPVSVQEFAKRVKEKYPDYKDVDDLTLATKMVEKYPEYKDRVQFDQQPIPPGPITETQPVVPERQTSYIPEVVAGGKALVGSIPATNKELSINTPNTPKISDSYQVPKPTVIPQGTGDRFKAIDQAQLEKEVGGAQIVQESKPTIQPTESQKQWAENNPNLNAIFSMPGMGVFKDAYIGTKKAIGGLGTTLDVIASNISNNITGGMQTDESGNITAPWEKGYKQDKSEFYQNVRKFEEETPVSSGGATAFIGQLLPQTAALAATVLLRSPSASKAYLASMYGSAFGNGVETYDDYIKETGKQEDPMDRYLVGMGYGAAEYIGEKIGLDYFLPKGYGKLVSKSLDASPQMAKEIGRSVLENYAKLTKQPFSSVIKKVAIGSQVEGGQEVATELMDIAIDKWLTGKDVSGQEIRDRLVESYGGGALMGAGIAPFASVSQNAATSQRRKDQGTVTISIDEEGLPVEIIETEDKVFGIRPDGEEVKNISEATLNKAATFKTDVFENAIKEFSKTNKITTATIEGKQYTIKNPEDLGIEGKPIFATDETGKVIPVSGKKKDQITDVVTQTQGEIDKAQQTAVDQQALRNGILDPNAQIINEENYEDEGTRVVDFSNGQSKIIYNGQEVIANDINEKDAILNSINDFQKLPEPKVTEVGEVIEPAPERKVITQTIGNTPIDIIEGEEFDEVVPTDKVPLEKAYTALEKKFKDNKRFKVVAEKVQIEEPGETKYDDPIKKTVIKSIKIVPVEVLEKQKQAETDNLLNIVEEYNATPQSREDKQKAGEIESIARKLGYQTERNAMNQIRLFDQSGTISKPNVSKNVNIENQNTENVPDITEQLFNNEQIVNSQPENNSQNIQQNEKPIEKVNRIDGQINQLPGENTTQTEQGQGVSEGLEENVNKIQPWIDKWEKLKTANNVAELDNFYDNVRVMLNGPAQSSGDDVVKEFQNLKKDIETYAEEFKSSQSVSAEQPVTESKTVIPATDTNVATKKQKQKSNSITGKAKEIEVSQTDPKDLALKYFVDGGLVTSDDVLKQFKGDNGERLARMSYTSNENGLSIAQIAHNIEESLPESVREGLGAMDVFNAVEDVISTHNSPIGMAKTLLSKYSIDENQGYSKEWLDQQLLNEESERLAELELWSNYYKSGQLPTENELIELFNTEENEQEIDNGRIIESNGPVNPEGNVENREVLQGSKPSVSEEIESAASEVNTNPSEAQKEAGNYKKGHVTIQGMDITIENPKGSFRKGVDENGKAWETELKSHYGYFKRTEGKDGDHIDVFIGENPESQTVYVIDQVFDKGDKSGLFDESKVMLGYNSPKEAADAYIENYSDDFNGLSDLTEVSIDQFKEWLYDGARQRKPFADYKNTPEPVALREEKQSDVRFRVDEAQTDTPKFKKWFGKSVFTENGKVGGTPMILYHGTDRNFDSFRPDRMIYLTPSAEYANMYTAGQSAKGAHYVGKTEQELAAKTYSGESIMPVFARAENPFDTRNLKHKAIFQKEYFGKYGNGAPLDPERGLPDWTDAEDLQEFFDEKGYDFDGLVLAESHGNITYAVFSPNQIKSATGNSGEFGMETDDVRFRVSPIEDENNLVAVHNIKPEGLLNADRLGGLPMPSIAIIDVNNGFNSYGEITLIADKDFVDPKKNKSAKVFASDVYSARYPSISHELPKQGNNKLIKKVNYVVPEEMSAAVINGIKNAIDDGGLSELNYSDSAKVLFLSDTQKPLEIKYSESKIPESIQKIFIDNGWKNLEYFEVVNNDDIKKQLTDLYFEKDGADKEVRMFLSEDGFLNGNLMRNFINDVKESIRSKGKVDTYATRRAADNYVRENNLQDEFESYIRKLYNELGVEEKIYRGYSNSGNRLYSPHTLSNVLKEMKKSGIRGGENFGYGAGNIRAKVTPEFKSLKDIQSNRGRITQFDDDIKNSANQELIDVMDAIKPFYKFDSGSFGYYDNNSDELVPLARSGRSESFNQLDSSSRKMVIDFLNKLANMPTGYFEAKINRGVSLAEFKNALIPSDTSKDVRDVLKFNGINAIEYTDNEDRTEKLKQITEDNDLRFRILGETGAANLDKAEEATTRLDNLAVAREMETYGKDAKTILLATGWEKGADGKWRYEVDDSDISFDNNIVAELRDNQTLANKVHTFSNMNYRKNDDGTYDFSMMKKGATSTSEFATYRNIPDSDLEFIFDNNTELISKIRKGEGGEGYIGANMDEAKELNIEFEHYVSGGTTLGSLIENKDVFKSYPQLKKVIVVFDPNAKSEGSFNKDNGFLGENMGSQDVITVKSLSGARFKSVLLHEVQHAIQDIEGFAKGGNLNIGANALIEKKQKTLDKINAQIIASSKKITSGNLTIEERSPMIETHKLLVDARNSIDNQIENIKKNEAPKYKAYQSLAGEVESRNVQTRLNMTPEERRNTLLQETEDVAREDQIVLMEGLGVSNFQEPVVGENINVSEKASSDLSSRPNVVKSLVKISEELGEPVNIINSSEIPEKVGELKKQITSGNRVPAFFYNGKIYLLSDQITSVSDALKSYLHELIVHKGLRDVFAGADKVSIIGKQYAKFNDLMSDVFASMSRSQKIEIASKYAPGLYNKNGKIMHNPTIEEKALIGEEFLAHVSENQEIYDEPTLTRWQLFINRLGQIIRKAFRLTSNQFSQKDLLDIVRESRARIKSKSSAGKSSQEGMPLFRATEESKQGERPNDMKNNLFDIPNDENWQDNVWDQFGDIDGNNLGIFERHQDSDKINKEYSSYHFAYEPGLRRIYANPKAYDEVTEKYNEEGYLSEGYFENTYDPEDFKLKEGYVAAISAKDNGIPHNVIYGAADDKFAITFIGDEIANLYDGKVVKYIQPLEVWEKTNGEFKKQTAKPNTILINGVSRSTLNSNGKPIANSEEGIRNFWKWFGDSKVVDAEGRPLVVYHGTNADFDVFKRPFKAVASNTEREAPLFFSPNPKSAVNFSKGYGSNIVPVYIKSEKLFDVNNLTEKQLDDIEGFLYDYYKANDSTEDEANEQAYQLMKQVSYGSWGALQSDEINQYLTDEKFDGFTEVEDGELAYAVFSPSQIKSATGNTGSFSPESNDIRFQIVKDEALNQLKEDLDKITSLGRYSEELKELEKTKVGKKVAERKVIIKQISGYKQGYKAGVAEKRLTLQVIKRNITKYANENMNYDDATRFEITQLLTALNNANTPATITKAFDKIDELASRGLKRKLISRISKTLKAASIKIQSGKPIGRLQPESYKAIDSIKQLMGMTPEEYDNYLDSIPDNDVESMALASMFGNLKEKSVSETFEALTALNSIIFNGRAWYKEKVESLKTKHKELIEKAVSDITGGKGIQSTQDIRSEKGVVDKNSYFKEYLGKNQSFEWLLDLISNNKNDRTGWGFMQDHFGDLASKSENLESKGLRDSIELVNKKAFEIFGKEKSKLAKIFGDNSRVVKKSGVTYISKTGARKEIPLSQNEGYKRWMEMNDPSLATTFEKMGWDSQSLNELESFLDPKVLAWAKWQINEFFPEYYKRVNEVYKKMYYVDLPFNPSYSGFLKREKTSVGDNEDTLLRPDTLIQSVSNSSLKSRIKNVRDIVLQDGDQALAKHIAEMEHFMAWAETIREIRAVLSSDSVQDAIKKEHGNNIRTVLNERINSLVRGGVDRGEVNYLVDWIRKNYVTSALGVNLSLTPKQMTAMFSYLNDISIMDYIKGAAEFMANPSQAIEILSQSEFIQRRYKKGWTHEIEAAMKKNNPNTMAGTKSTINSIRDALMLPVMLGDKFAVYAGYPVYAKFYKQYKTDNPTASEQEASDFAINKFERITKRTQQSSDVSDTSRFQETSFGKVFMMFKNAQQQYFRYEMAAINNLIKGKGNSAENAKIIIITHIVLPVIFQMVANWFTDEDDDKENKRLLRAALLGPIDGLMIAGDIIGFGLEKIMGEKWSYSASPMLDVTQDLGNSIQQIIKYINEPYPENEAEDLQKALDFAIQFTSSTMTGIPYEPAKKLYKKATGEEGKVSIQEDASDIISKAEKYLKYVRESAKRKDIELYKKLTSDKESLKAATYLNNYNLRITKLKKAIKFYTQSGDDVKVTELQKKLEETYQEIISKYSDVDFPNRYKLSK